MKKLISLLASLSLSAVIAQAGITAAGPFTGSHSESFESFDNYNKGPFYISEPAPLMGGFASIKSEQSNLVIYQPGSAEFGLAGGGFAKVADGQKGLGINSISSATLLFNSSVYAFGGYFGAANNTEDEIYYTGNISFNFSNGESALYDFAGNELKWLGWSSDTPIESVTISGPYVVMDGLQVDGECQQVPDNSSSLALFAAGLGLIGLLRRRQK